MCKSRGYIIGILYLPLNFAVNLTLFLKKKKSSKNIYIYT